MYDVKLLGYIIIDKRYINVIIIILLLSRTIHFKKLKLPKCYSLLSLFWGIIFGWMGVVRKYNY